jgi:hypothetical protein
MKKQKLNAVSVCTVFASLKPEFQNAVRTRPFLRLTAAASKTLPRSSATCLLIRIGRDRLWPPAVVSAQSDSRLKLAGESCRPRTWQRPARFAGPAGSRLRVLTGSAVASTCLPALRKRPRANLPPVQQTPDQADPECAEGVPALSSLRPGEPAESPTATVTVSKFAHHALISLRLRQSSNYLHNCLGQPKPNTNLDLLISPKL